MKANKKMLPVYLVEDDHAMLKLLAAQEGVSMSSIAASLIKSKVRKEFKAK